VAPDIANSMAQLIKDIIAGFICAPIDLGRFSTYGRALRAKREMYRIITDIMNDPVQGDEGSHNVIKDLAAATAEGKGFTVDEICDTILTLLFAGQVTTSDALPNICVELARRPEWARKVAADNFELTQIEDNNSPTLHFLREVLRHHPPESLFQRTNKEKPIDLGRHGQVPVGCNVVMNFGHAQWLLGTEFNPDLWTDQVAHEHFLTFGGHSPHSCVGRNLAMVEMQMFARVLCREYEVEALDTTKIRDWSMGGLLLKYKDGCKLKVKKRQPDTETAWWMQPENTKATL